MIDERRAPKGRLVDNAEFKVELPTVFQAPGVITYNHPLFDSAVFETLTGLKAAYVAANHFRFPLLRWRAQCLRR